WYSLYWIIPGTPPTFLQITGTVDGDIPDGSPYDLNNELIVNASVRGFDAVRDVTPIYATVWWQAGDVVYMVSSLNLTGDDTLSLANSLVALVPPGPPDGGDLPAIGESPAVSPALEVPETVFAGEEISVGVAGITTATLTADDGIFVDVASATYPKIGAYAVAWRSPSSTEDRWVSFYLIDPGSGEWLTTAATLVLGSAAQGPVATLECPGSTLAGELRYVTVSGSGTIVVSASDGSWPNQPPNTLFDPQADGGRSLNGALSNDRAATLLWRAPSNSSASNVRFSVTGPDGTVLAECAAEVGALVVTPASQPNLPPQSTQPQSVPHSNGETAGSSDGPGGNAPRESNVAPPVSTVKPTTRTVAQVAPRPSPTTSPSPIPPTSTPAPPTVPVATLRPGIQANDGTGGANPALLPTPTAGPTSTLAAPPPTATATMAAATGADGLVAMVIGPEGGELLNPSGAMLTIPAGALDEPATVRIKPVRDSRLPVDIAIDLVPGTGFDFSVATLGGDSVAKLRSDATLRLMLAPGQWQEGIELYRIENGRLNHVDGAVLNQDGISVELDHFSRFVAGIPTADEVADRNAMAWLVLGGGALLTLGVALWIIRRLARSRASIRWTRRSRSPLGSRS
nr:hypothetical protein [Chloroflexia bacterium]